MRARSCSVARGPPGRRRRHWRRPRRVSCRDPGRKLCKGNGVDVVSGLASFTGPNTLQIRRAGGLEDFSFTDAIIATGGRPSDLPSFRFDGLMVISTKEALELERTPPNLAIIGGGVSGL
ncbi:MAG: hypothetical protein E6K06_00225, partial [Methanobacteriota archaeon]